VDATYSDTVRIDKVWVKAKEVGEVVDDIINQAYVVVGIDPGKLYPVNGKDPIIGEVNTKI